MSRKYAGISDPKIEILEWYVKKGGNAGFFHDLPTDVQIRLQMGHIHELLEQDVNRWLQDHGNNPHMETPDWLAAEDVEEEPCPHCNGEGSCEWCDGEGCRHCGYVEGDCEWCGGTGFEAESFNSEGDGDGMLCPSCSNNTLKITEDKGLCSVCGLWLSSDELKQYIILEGHNKSYLMAIIMGMIWNQSTTQSIGSACNVCGDKMKSVPNADVGTYCRSCDAHYGGPQVEHRRFAQATEFSQKSESFSAEYRPKWKEEKKHHRSNPTYTCSFQIKDDPDDDYYATHKLQIQKVKGKWVVHELDTRYVTPNARLRKDRLNTEEYWRAISDPYNTVDEAKKSMVEEITQSKCHHDDGYRIVDPTQIFYDSHEYVDFVCVNCGAIGYGDMGENSFRGIETRWAEGEESFATEGRTFKCGGCWRELPLKERSRKRKESMGQEEMCRPCMKMSDADYVDSLIAQGGMAEYDRVAKDLYGDWDLHFNEPEICSVCGETGGHICFEAESFTDRFTPPKAVEVKADLALIGAGAIVGLLIGGIMIRD